MNSDCAKKAGVAVHPSWDLSRLWQAARADNQRSGPVSGGRREERRSDRRYPIEADLEYRITNRKRVIKTGSGRTVDISSNGILFESNLSLPRGLKIELSINWPALPATTSRIELLAEGRTVRGERNLTAVQIQKYMFRGRQRAGQSAG
jgi:hypothetical protein